MGGGVGSGGVGLWGQGGCEQGIEVLVKIQKKNSGGGGRVGGGVGSVGGRVGGGQPGCERRIEVFVKIQKKWGVGSGGGVRLEGGFERGIVDVRVDVNEELKFW